MDTTFPCFSVPCLSGWGVCVKEWGRRSQPWSSRSLGADSAAGARGVTLPFSLFPEAGGPACALVQPSTIVREGFLLKRKEEPAGLATRFAFKKRYFRLSGQDLSYSKTPEWQVRLQPQEDATRVLGETEAQGGSWGNCFPNIITAKATNPKLLAGLKLG